VLLSTGTVVHGRVLTGVGAVGTTAFEGLADMIPDNCGMTVSNGSAHDEAAQVAVYPNPFTSSVTINVSDASDFNVYQMKVLNAMGAEVFSRSISHAPHWT